MTVETDHQTDIRKSVLKLGGHSFKLTNRFTIGVPDLSIALPPFVPGLWEVKTLGAVADKFDRDIGLSAKQKDTLVRYQKGYDEPVCGVLVHVIYQRIHRLYGFAFASERCCHNDRFWIPRQVHNYYDIHVLFSRMGVMRCPTPSGS